MPIYRYSKTEKPNIAPSLMALGIFDGLHIGHRALLREAAKQAENMGLPLSVFTFDFTSSLKGGTSLYSPEVKCELLFEAGVENIVIADFSSISSLDAEEFVHDVLVGQLSVRCAIAGEDFRFGKGRCGDAAMLSSLLSSHGVAFTAFPTVSHSYDSEKISSAEIKEHLKLGNVPAANKLLSVPYFLSGTVEHGRGVGHKLGMPTVNLSLHKGSGFLKHGVYASCVELGGKSYTGVTNIGVCPTFEEREPHAETLILDFNASLYGEKIRIYLYEYLRPEMKFPSGEALARQVMSDADAARKISKRKD